MQKGVWQFLFIIGRDDTTGRFCGNRFTRFINERPSYPILAADRLEIDVVLSISSISVTF